jgi:hypothetical protein
MTFVVLSPAFLSFVLLAAHFYRAHHLVLVAVVVLLLAMMGLRRAWVPRVLQAALVLGALEWLMTMTTLVQERSALGQPYWRLTSILGAVCVLTALSSLGFRTRLSQAFFNQPGK